jgi:hypothetical protein
MGSLLLQYQLSHAQGTRPDLPLKGWIGQHIRIAIDRRFAYPNGIGPLGLYRYRFGHMQMMENLLQGTHVKPMQALRTKRIMLLLCQGKCGYAFHNLENPKMTPE